MRQRKYGKTEGGRTLKSNSENCPVENGTLERAVWSFPRRPRKTKSEQSEEKGRRWVNTSAIQSLSFPRFLCLSLLRPEHLEAVLLPFAVGEGNCQGQKGVPQLTLQITLVRPKLLCFTHSCQNCLEKGCQGTTCRELSALECH